MGFEDIFEANLYVQRSSQPRFMTERRLNLYFTPKGVKLRSFHLDIRTSCLRILLVTLRSKEILNLPQHDGFSKDNETMQTAHGCRGHDLPSYRARAVVLILDPSPFSDCNVTITT